VSAPRFRLKGGGWYETDFKKDNQRNVLKSDSESTKSDKKTEKKAESKPDAKPAAKSDS
jgi:predicted nucleic acid-binding Zn ribbon protein